MVIDHSIDTILCMKPIYRGEPGFATERQIHDSFTYENYGENIHSALEQGAPTLPETHIKASPEQIEQIYHLARSGVEITHSDYTGRPLALAAALDLEKYDHPQASNWVNGIYQERYNEGVNSEDFGRALDAMVGARELARRGFAGGLEMLTLTYEKMARIQPWNQQLQEMVFDEDGDEIGLEPIDAQREQQIYFDILTTGYVLAEAGIFDQEVMVGVYEKYINATNELIWGEVEQIPATYQTLKKLYNYMADICDETVDLETPLVAALQKLSQFTAWPDVTIRTAAMNSMADLREYYPRNRKLKRRANSVVFEHFAKHGIIFEKKNVEFDLEESHAIDRLSYGTILDFDAWAEVHHAVQHLSNDRMTKKVVDF